MEINQPVLYFKLGLCIQIPFDPCKITVEQMMKTVNVSIVSHKCLNEASRLLCQLHAQIWNRPPFLAAEPYTLLPQKPRRAKNLNQTWLTLDEKRIKQVKQEFVTLDFFSYSLNTSEKTLKHLVKKISKTDQNPRIFVSKTLMPALCCHLPA